MPLRTPFDRFEGANGETMDATLLKFDAVRSALALVAFGVTGCLAWLHGDVATRAADEGDPVSVVSVSARSAARPTPQRQ